MTTRPAAEGHARLPVLALLSIAMVLAISLAGAAMATGGGLGCANKGATAAPDTLTVDLQSDGGATRDGTARAKVFVSRRLAGQSSLVQAQPGASVNLVVVVGGRQVSAHGVTNGEGWISLATQFPRGVRGYADATAVATREVVEPDHCPPTRKLAERGSKTVNRLTYVSS